MKRTRKKHNAVIKLLPVVDPVRMNAELTCQLSDRPVPPRGGERFLRRRRACWERGVSKSVVLLTGDRWFESISLHRRVVANRTCGGGSHSVERRPFNCSPRAP